ncbi:tyrosine--tRNA ligase [Cryomorpha ignava]|uniref:Tyrosine--tRNA ligase n=1 Tax=Cryomorpha ignava TaxID=101383 RepID=A0A7K3WTY8_9FLAO|nr:tyrosine--tRNA ligase [Cryomorpha ignava]NEN24946.1 tyrosine--tRNA ligase [Cryomorpha ignava]
MNLIEELAWRGLIQDITPETEEQLNKELTSGYVGFDPTADSLHIGNLVPIMLLTHLQRSGHKPFALIGGATGRVGDPSGKTQERQLLTTEIIEHNLASQKKQLEQFLKFGDGPTDAEIVNNYEWFKKFTFLDFIRDVGKHITINYMMSKDSVKNRLESGMSFTEFSYQLIQGYDFYYLNKEKNIKLQMGGSDQWGNITTGIELTRRMGGGDTFAITAPLVKKADGTKFGKSEGGNVWLDAEKTSPYKFYQFWLNATDEDIENFIKVFSLLSRSDIEKLIAAHVEAPHLRLLQRTLAEELTLRIHGAHALEMAIEASSILFGNATAENLKKLSERDFLDVFQGVEQVEVARSLIEAGVDIVEMLSEISGFLSSKSEARRSLKENAISVNKDKVGEDYKVSASDLISDAYILLQRGKKKYFVVRAV